MILYFAGVLNLTFITVADGDRLILKFDTIIDILLVA